MRGPGRSRSGKSVERTGKRCPAPLADYHMVQKLGSQIVLADLVPGSIWQQPADTYLFYANLLSKEAEFTERLTYLQQKKQQAGNRGRGR